MKKLLYAICCVLLVAMVAWLVGCTKDMSTSTPTSAGDATGTKVSVKTGPNTPGANAGTTLSDVVTASCFNYYDWTCTQASITDPVKDCYRPGDCEDLTATVAVAKGAHHVGYSGTICVTNGGGKATDGLKVGAYLEYHASGGYDSSSCGVFGLESQYPVLAAGESHCYTYTINVSAGCLISDNNSYRVAGAVTILNHSGSIGEPKGPQGKSDSYDLCAPSNDCINVSYAPATPLNALSQPDASSWTVNVTSTNPVNVCASGNVNFTVRFCDVSAPEGETFTFGGSADVDGHTCSTQFAAAACIIDHGCSYTQGFWKTHGCVGPNGKSQYGNNANLITPLIPVGGISMGNLLITSCEQAGAVFQNAEGNAGNAIKRLYSQMLAAKLNMLNGADGSCIATAIDDANAVLTAADPSGDASGWASISGANRSKVQSLAGTFDQYNNGLLCVKHCE
jgi:hypothetical protein